MSVFLLHFLLQKPILQTFSLLYTKKRIKFAKSCPFFVDEQRTEK